jgi:hypothetical protein
MKALCPRRQDFTGGTSLDEDEGWGGMTGMAGDQPQPQRDQHALPHVVAFRRRVAVLARLVKLDPAFLGREERPVEAGGRRARAELGIEHGREGGDAAM